MMQRFGGHCLRLASRTSGAQTRKLAIQATVGKAADDSAVEYPAPSHVNVVAEAKSLVRQYKEFFSNPDSTVVLDDETHAALTDSIAKKVAAIPDSKLDDAWVRANLTPPKEIKMGDNPLFGK